MNDRPQPVSGARKGLALLTVLALIMAITMLSLGYIARCDVDLAAGQNMTTRLELDQLASSGLEHARGLILNPQGVAGEYWTGGTGLQLDADSGHFYDVVVAQDANDCCNYKIISNAYRLSHGQQRGASTLSAMLRLDPCITLWAGGSITVPASFSIRGDVYCNGTLTNEGAIDGDTFSNGVVGAGTASGAGQSPGDLSLTWPAIDASYTHPDYPTMSIGPGTVSARTYSPASVRYCSGDLTLGNNVTVEGMLLVDGDLTITGSGNRILAGKNLPALYVSGDLIVDDVTSLDIEGLAMVGGDCWVGAAASDIDIQGGLFLSDAIRQTAPDSAGGNHDLRMYGQPAWQPLGGQAGGGVELDGVDDYLQDRQAGGYLNGLDAITVSLWVDSDVTGQDRGIFYVRDPDHAGADMDLGMRYDKYGAFGHARNCIKASIGTWGDYTQIESSDYVQTTGWQHLVLVWSTGNILKLYINGAYDSHTYSKGVLSGNIFGVDRFTLGKGSYDKPWDGGIDEVRIYSRALSDVEIGQLYTNPSGGTTVGLLARYKLDEDGPGVEIRANPAVAAIETADKDRWSPAAGAFFKSINR